MPDIDVKSYIDELRRFIPYVPPVSVEEIKALYGKRELGSVVKLIRSAMNVGVGLTVHWTDGPAPKEIPNAPAWCSEAAKLDRFWVEFSAVIPRLGGAESDEGLEVFGRPEGVHIKAGR
jgi:hypothetical protein